MLRFVYVFALMIPTIVLAQVPDPAVAGHLQPTTKIEAFSARTGIVVIKGFSTIGSVAGQGRVSVDAREFRDASNPKSAEYGIAIEVKESSRLERESRSFVDQDEIDSLLRGIDYIAKATKSVTALQNFEAEYRTKGDFSVTVFSDSAGGLRLAVSSGRIGKATAFLTMADLDRLRSLIVDARRAIDAAKSGSRS